MSFSSKWLALREPVDHAARNQKILAAVETHFSKQAKLKITDIGSGTGSTIRALKPKLQCKTQWHLIDNDDALIEIAKAEAGGDSVQFSNADLSRSLEPLFLDEPALISTSAFLDLVSQDWLEALVREVARQKIPFYGAITYDGRAGCTPEHPTDKLVLDAFNLHQKTDKGFGSALGPQAADQAISLFKTAGYEVIVGTSDWQAKGDHKGFQKMLLEGWANAAVQMKPELTNTFEQWLAQRYDLIENSDAGVFVGHKDFFATPKQK